MHYHRVRVCLAHDHLTFIGKAFICPYSYTALNTLDDGFLPAVFGVAVSENVVVVNINLRAQAPRSIGHLLCRRRNLYWCKHLTPYLYKISSGLLRSVMASVSVSRRVFRTMFPYFIRNPFGVQYHGDGSRLEGSWGFFSLMGTIL